MEKDNIEKKNNPFALWGFVLGIASVFLGMGLVPIVAIVLSITGIKHTKKGAGDRKMAIVGLILGIIYTIVYLYNSGYLG